jgi:hypothetical protein
VAFEIEKTLKHVKNAKKRFWISVKQFALADITWDDQPNRKKSPSFLPITSRTRWSNTIVQYVTHFGYLADIASHHPLARKKSQDFPPHSTLQSRSKQKPSIGRVFWLFGRYRFWRIREILGLQSLPPIHGETTTVTLFYINFSPSDHRKKIVPSLAKSPSKQRRLRREISIQDYNNEKNYNNCQNYNKRTELPN